jgi:hypothetical protein
MRPISDDLEIISDALKVIPDALKVISDDLPSCSLVVFLQIVEIGRYSRYAATPLQNLQRSTFKSSSYIALRPLWAVKNGVEM